MSEGKNGEVSMDEIYGMIDGDIDKVVVSIPEVCKLAIEAWKGESKVDELTIEIGDEQRFWDFVDDVNWALSEFGFDIEDEDEGIWRK
jgi:hypothetical protein